MKLMKAIEAADALCPNHYTLEEKIGWCDEVSAEIRRTVLKKYDVIETEVDSYGNVVLPADIPAERAEMVFCDGKLLNKHDFRSFFARADEDDIRPVRPSKLRVVYLTLPDRVRYIDIRGEFNTGDNYIEIDLPPFKEGDMIEICSLGEIDTAEPDWDNCKCAYVMEAYLDKIILDSDILTPETSSKLAIRRVIDDVTEADEAPYDSMYIEYLLAKYALYQHDYPGYNAHMTQYQCLFEAMRRDTITRRPLTSQVRFKNYSIT